MTHIVQGDLPKNVDLALISDLHGGSLTAREEHFRNIVRWAVKGSNPKRAIVFAGDIIEGVTVDHKHYAPETMHHDAHTPELQLKRVTRIIDEEKGWGHFALILKGNHGRRNDMVSDLIGSMCERHDVPYGGEQCHWDMGNGVRAFAMHGCWTMPRQPPEDHPDWKKAKQRKWLRNRLVNLSTEAHIMLMGHTHQLLVCPPEPILTFRADYQRNEFKAEKQFITDSGMFVHPWSRWFVNTGALCIRRLVGRRDYGDAFDPIVIGYVRCNIRDGSIEKCQEVVL